MSDPRLFVYLWTAGCEERGGGARGGGSLLELGLEFFVDQDSMAPRELTEADSGGDCKEPSVVEGVISERKERSSEDRERDVGLSCADDAVEAGDGFREKRLKKRDTADA